MSFTIIAVAAVGVSAAVSLYSATESAKNARAANRIATANAQTTARLADEANNKANAKTPDSAAAMAASVMASQSGQSGTMLTGPQGIDPTQLTLGRNTLLGG